MPCIGFLWEKNNEAQSNIWQKPAICLIEPQSTLFIGFTSVSPVKTYFWIHPTSLCGEEPGENKFCSVSVFRGSRAEEGQRH